MMFCYANLLKMNKSKYKMQLVVLKNFPIFSTHGSQKLCHGVCIELYYLNHIQNIPKIICK